VDIFDSFDRSTDLQVDVTVKQDQQLSWMGYHNFVVKDILMLLNGPSIVQAGIIWITILLDNGLIGKGLGKPLFADIVFQTPLGGAGP